MRTYRPGAAACTRRYRPRARGPSQIKRPVLHRRAREAALVGHQHEPSTAGQQADPGDVATGQIAQKAEKITGPPTLFGTSPTGPYGSVGFLTGYENIGQLEAAQSKLASDESWIKLIDSTKGCFVEDPTITQSTIYRRLA